MCGYGASLAAAAFGRGAARPAWPPATKSLSAAGGAESTAKARAGATAHEAAATHTTTIRNINIADTEPVTPLTKACEGLRNNIFPAAPPKAREEISHPARRNGRARRRRGSRGPRNSG